MNLNGFEEMEQPTKKYEWNQKEVDDVIMGNRNALKPHSRMFNNNSANDRMRELQEKAEKGTLNAEEATELFELSAGIESKQEEK